MKCNEESCFGRTKRGACGVLTACSNEYKAGRCPFRKEDKEVTDNIRYPYNKHYGDRLRRDV